VSIWDNQLLGVIVGGAIVSATQFRLDWRAGKRGTQAAKAAANAEWGTLQIATIVDLQDQLDAYMMLIGRLVTQPPKPGLFGKPSPLPDYSSYGRAAMLCSRLEDPGLAADVRQWLKDMNTRLIEDPPLTSGSVLAYTERRVVLQDRLGEAIKKYHGH
jgi:hypothetical protein